jgi:hypothetical protein
LRYLGNFISDAVASFCLVVSFGTKAMIAVLVNDGATFAFVLDVGVEDGNAYLALECRSECRVLDSIGFIDSAHSHQGHGRSLVHNGGQHTSSTSGGLTSLL